MNAFFKKTIIVAGVFIVSVPIIAILYTLALRIALGEIEINLINFSFTDILSTLLAFFAITLSLGLSIKFYELTRITSDIFQHDMLEFRKETAVLLGRIESGFGEKLDNLSVNNFTPERLAETIKLFKETQESQTEGSQVDQKAIELAEKTINNPARDQTTKNKYELELKSLKAENNTFKQKLQKFQEKSKPILEISKEQLFEVLLKQLSYKTLYILNKKRKAGSPIETIEKTFLHHINPKDRSVLEKVNLAENGNLTADGKEAFNKELDKILCNEFHDIQRCFDFECE